MGNEENQNVEAEASILGVLLTDSSSISNVSLAETDFSKTAHRTIFNAITDLEHNGTQIDHRSVIAHLAQHNQLDTIPGGPVFITSLTEYAPSVTAAPYYVRLIKEASARRVLASIGTDTHNTARTDTDPVTIIENMRTRLDELETQDTINNTPTVTEVLDQTFTNIDLVQRGESERGVPTGFTDLDQKILGLMPGQMVIVAARPAMGKSSFALDIARHAALRENKSVLIFSLEMSAVELGTRALAAEAYVELQSMKTPGTLTDADWRALQEASQNYGTKPFGIDDQASITLPQIRSKARRWQRANGLDLIVIDYLQLITPANRSHSREQEVAEMSRNIKLLAKELNVPIIVLCQVNRAAEQRADKKPMLSDLRESGSLEQDADLVILLHREEVYDQETPRVGEADIIIAKQRSGPTGTIVLSWIGKYSRFDNRTF